MENGPADLAGLKNGDRVVCINGERVDAMEHEEVSRGYLSNVQMFFWSFT